MADLTMGTAFVLVHLALADKKMRERRGAPRIAVDGRRIWPSQISP